MTLLTYILAYSPDEARDDKGRWTGPGKSTASFPPAELAREIAKLRTRSYALNDRFIARGWGEKKLSELPDGDPDVDEYKRIGDRLTNLHREEEYRMKYHGNLKRVPGDRWWERKDS